MIVIAKYVDLTKKTKKSDFFTGIQCPLFHGFLINVAIISDTILLDNLVFIREGWYSFTITHTYLLVTDVIYSHKGTEKVYIYQYPSSLTHLSKKTINKSFT